MLTKIIHIDDFFADDVTEIYNTVATLQFTEHEFGNEIENFSLVFPDIENVFSRVLNEPISLYENRSGIFREPYGFIHFEGFNYVTDWCLAIAIKETTFNVFEHHSGARTALDEYRHNYRDLFAWDLKTNIVMKPNNCLFFRPWLFHSFIGGLTQMYYLKSEK